MQNPYSVFDCERENVIAAVAVKRQIRLFYVLHFYKNFISIYVYLNSSIPDLQFNDFLESLTTAFLILELVLK